MFISRRDIHNLIDQHKHIQYGQDKYSKKVLANLDKDDSNKHLTTRNRLTEYFKKYDHHENIDMIGYKYKKADVEAMIEDPYIKKLLLELHERKTTDYYFPDLGIIRVPIFVASYFDSEQHAQDGEYRRINTMLDKKGSELTIEELKELIDIKSTTVWNTK